MLFEKGAVPKIKVLRLICLSDSRDRDSHLCRLHIVRAGLQLRDRNAVIAFAVGTEPEARNALVTSQMHADRRP